MRNILLAAASIVPLCALATCADEDSTSIERHRPRGDAGTTIVDAPATSSGGGDVTCYRQNAPSASCAAPDHCCFSNYSAQHDGACSSSTCAYGTISCDGAEDCASGERCCSHALWGADGLYGYGLACQATACGAPPLDYEVCHPGDACANGGTCTSVYGVVNDLPRTLYVCR